MRFIFKRWERFISSFLDPSHTLSIITLAARCLVCISLLVNYFMLPFFAMSVRPTILQIWLECVATLRFVYQALQQLSLLELINGT